MSDQSGKDKSCSDEDDFIPLSKLLMKPQSEEKKSCDNTSSVTASSNRTSKRDEGSEDSRKHDPS